MKRVRIKQFPGEHATNSATLQWSDDGLVWKDSFVMSDMATNGDWYEYPSTKYPNAVSWQTRAGRGGCPTTPVNEVVLMAGGLDTEREVQDKCEEVSCAYYIWSRDPNDQMNTAWFCATDYYDLATPEDVYPLWRVGRPNNLAPPTPRETPYPSSWACVPAHSKTFTVTTTVAELCAQTSGSPTTLEATLCDDGINVRWDKMSTAQTRPGLTSGECQWTREMKAANPEWIDAWMGSCGKAPTRLPNLPLTICQNVPVTAPPPTTTAAPQISCGPGTHLEGYVCVANILPLETTTAAPGPNKPKKRKKPGETGDDDGDDDDDDDCEDGDCGCAKGGGSDCGVSLKLTVECGDDGNTDCAGAPKATKAPAAASAGASFFDTDAGSSTRRIRVRVSCDSDGNCSNADDAPILLDTSEQVERVPSPVPFLAPAPAPPASIRLHVSQSTADDYQQVAAFDANPVDEFDVLMDDDDDDELF